MKMETYDRIWDNIIKPIYKNICENSDGDEVLRLNESVNKKRILRRYIKIRDKIKVKYMDNSNENIDRHKIASILMAAIEEAYPIKISKKYVYKLWKEGKKLNTVYLYANELLALYTALSIIENFKDYGIDGNIEKKRNSIIMPKPFNESDYKLNICIDLYYAKRSKKLNVLTFSNVFFLLERLSEQGE